MPSATSKSAQPEPEAEHSILPPRRAAKRASNTLTQQLAPLTRRKSAPGRLSGKAAQMSNDSGASTDGNDQETHESTGVLDNMSLSSTASNIFPSPQRNKPQVHRKYGGQRKLSVNRKPVVTASSDTSALSRSSSLESGSSPMASSKATSRKRSRQSDATDAESDAVPKKKRAFVIMDNSKLMNKARRLEHNEKSSKPPPKSKPKSKPRASVPIILLEKQRDSLAPGDVVWVRLGSEGGALASAETPGMWWPSTIKSSSTDSVDIRLLGKSVPGGYKQREQTVKDLSLRSILPFRLGPTIRFDATTFAEAGFENEKVAPSDSPAKRVIDVRSMWQAGVEDALNLDDDDLPLDLSQSSAIIASPQDKKKAVDVEQKVKPAKDGPIDWTADPRFAPGTYMLCKETKQAQIYWPARVDEIVPAPKPGAAGKYKVTFCDGTVKNVSADWMISEDQDTFLTCRLGTLAVAGEDLKEDGRKSPVPRDPSPEPRDTPPTESDFEDYTFREQVACIRPVLQKIICGEYPPAKTRHDAFIQGGRQRLQLSQKIVTGNLSNSEIDAVSHEIRRWALRGERWARTNEASDTVDAPASDTPEVSADLASVAEPQDTIMVDVEDDWRTLPSDKVPRPKGSTEYEALRGSERSQYCSDVLLPEALVQLHALRHGMRTGKLIEDDMEVEQAFHSTVAESLANEQPIDGWVDQILSRRQQRRIARGMPATEALDASHKGANGSPTKGSTRSRRAYN